MRLIHGGAPGPDRPYRPGAPELSAGAKAWLVQNVETDVRARVPNPASPTLPPGGVDYRLEFILPWEPWGPDARFPDLEAVLESVTGVTADPVAERFEVEVVVGGADLVMVYVLEPDLFQALDARSQELADMYPVLFTRGDVIEELEDTLSNAGAAHAILVGDLTIEDAWQDTDLASVGLGLGLAELSRGCAFAAIDTLVQDIERRAAADLGFEPWRNGVHVLDVGKTTLDIRIADLLGIIPARDL